MRSRPLLIAFALTAALPSLAAAKGKPHHKTETGPAPVAAADSKGAPTLAVTCSPPGAEVLVDGEKVGVAPITQAVPVTPGDHTIKVTKLGFAPFLDTFSTKKQKNVKLEVELVPVSGVLHVRANQGGARVLVDGRFVGEAPVDIEVDVGARAIQVEKGGYKDFFKNTLAVAGRDETLEVKLEELPPELNPYYVKPLPPARWYQKKWVWGVILGAAALVAGGVAVAAVLATPGDPLAASDVRYTVKGLLVGFTH